MKDKIQIEKMFGTILRIISAMDYKFVVMFPAPKKRAT